MIRTCRALASACVLGALLMVPTAAGTRGPRTQSLKLPVGCPLELRVGLWTPSPARVYSFHTATSVPGSQVYEGLPPGVLFDAATGTLRWTPTDSDGGTDYHITVAAFDAEERVLHGMHALSIRVPAGERPIRVKKVQLRDIVGRWKVVDRMAEVPLAPLYVEFGPDGRGHTELIRYDENGNLATPDVDRFRYRLRVDGKLPDHGVIQFENLSGDAQTSVSVHGPHLILDDFLVDRAITLRRCRDAACQPERVRRCPKAKVAWVAPVPER